MVAWVIIPVRDEDVEDGASVELAAILIRRARPTAERLGEPEIRPPLQDAAANLLKRHAWAGHSRFVKPALGLQ